MTALREHLDHQGAYLCHSCPSDNGCTRCMHDYWDTLGERIRPPVNEEAIDRADAGAWFVAIVLVACVSALLIVHLVRS